MIGLVTDSNAQLPVELAERYGVEVVPLTVTIDGESFLEGVDLDADAFYRRFEGGRRPEVSTSQPSPGAFARAFRALADRGTDHILSVHIGSAVSGTVNSARLGAESAPVPVRVVDTGTVSFGVACCVWEAGEALAAGASLEEAARVAEQVGAGVGTVFTVGALDLARAGGRLAAPAPPWGDPTPAEPVPVLTMAGGEMKVVGRAPDLDGAVEAMAASVLAAGPSLRVGVGVADAAGAALSTALEQRLAGAPAVKEVVRYRIGPSVGAHTGPGTAGAFFYRSRSYPSPFYPSR
ncbi:MAG: DegV family EDD domain-containing protein [Actinobacteria bacterium]|nr:DegV family EDD domain-containing protein [Actinomycetota bacterium]